MKKIYKVFATLILAGSLTVLTSQASFAKRITRSSSTGIQQALSLAQNGQTDEAINILLPLANKKHDKQAMLLLSKIDFDLDKQEESFNWALKAAKSGLPEGQLILADDYLRGMGTSINNELGINWLKKAAANGYMAAQTHLGLIYQQGSHDQPQDFRQAAYWLKKAARQGDPIALNNVGLYFAHGKGVEQNTAIAAKYYKLAVEKNSTDAMNNLANLYWCGDGVPQDRNEAIRLFETASSNGHRGATQVLENINNGGGIDCDTSTLTFHH